MDQKLTDAVRAKSDCYVCNKHRNPDLCKGGAIYEDDLIFIAHFPLFGSNSSAYLGHIIIEPKRHVEKLSLLTPRESSKMGFWLTKMSGIMEKQMDVEHVYVFRLGDRMPHVHYHLVPRYKDTPEEFWGARIVDYTIPITGNERKVVELADMLRDAIQGTPVSN